MTAAPTIVIYGAGSIGCYVGGRLAATGTRVRFIGRARIAHEIGEHGLHLSDYRGAAFDLAPSAVVFTTDAARVADADLVLVTVKSAATATAAAEIAQHVRHDAVVISFQNGIGNDVVLREALPRNPVLAGMVQFNVIQREGGKFHQGSEGGLEVATHRALEAFLTAFERAGLPLDQHTDIAPIQWAKLLLNLNNSVNALSGLPLKPELAQRAYRYCIALAFEEGLRALKAEGIKPAKLTPLPVKWLPRLLRLPDSWFARLANKMLEIDPLARSSMQDDLAAGRTTEVDFLNGEIVRLARRHKLAAPVNAKLIDLVRAAERGGRRHWSGNALLAELTRGN